MNVVHLLPDKFFIHQQETTETLLKYLVCMPLSSRLVSLKRLQQLSLFCCFQTIHYFPCRQRFNLLHQAGNVAIGGPDNNVQVVGHQDIGIEFKGKPVFYFREGREKFFAEYRRFEERESFVGRSCDEVSRTGGGGVGPLFHPGEYARFEERVRSTPSGREMGSVVEYLGEAFLKQHTQPIPLPVLTHDRKVLIPSLRKVF